jgi:hypothetical protein
MMSPLMNATCSRDRHAHRNREGERMLTIGQKVTVRENGKDPQVFTVTAIRPDGAGLTLAVADQEESETS